MLTMSNTAARKFKSLVGLDDWCFRLSDLLVSLSDSKAFRISSRRERKKKRKKIADFCETARDLTAGKRQQILLSNDSETAVSTQINEAPLLWQV